MFNGHKQTNCCCFCRLSDLHSAINAHTRHPTLPALATEDETAAGTAGVWPVGSGDLKRGKKGDIFRLVGARRARGRQLGTHSKISEIFVKWTEILTGKEGQREREGWKHARYAT